MNKIIVKLSIFIIFNFVFPVQARIQTYQDIAPKVLDRTHRFMKTNTFTLRDNQERLEYLKQNIDQIAGIEFVQVTSPNPKEIFDRFGHAFLHISFKNKPWVQGYNVGFVVDTLNSEPSKRKFFMGKLYRRL